MVAKFMRPGSSTQSRMTATPTRMMEAKKPRMQAHCSRCSDNQFAYKGFLSVICRQFSAGRMLDHCRQKGIATCRQGVAEEPAPT